MSAAGVVLVSPELAASAGPSCRIVVDRPHEAMLKVLPALYGAPTAPPGVHPTAIIGRGARLGREISVGPYSVIGDGAELGDRVVIGAHCDVGRGVRVGDDSHLGIIGDALSGHDRRPARARCTPACGVGSDGFGYVYAGGAHQKIPHVGRCLIEDDVEIGANSAIDRGSIDDTVIGAGTKIDNLVHIAHNVRLGAALPDRGAGGDLRLHRRGRRRGARRSGGRRRASHDRLAGEDRGAGRCLERRAAGRDVVGHARAPASRDARGAGGARPARAHGEGTRAARGPPAIVSAAARRRTIAGSATLEGIGLHLGQQCRLTFKPGAAGRGIIFRRVDLEGAPEVPARIDQAVQVERRTQIGDGDRALHTVEHVLAAVAAHEIDDVLIEMDALGAADTRRERAPVLRRARGRGDCRGRWQGAVSSRAVAGGGTDGESRYEAHPADEFLARRDDRIPASAHRAAGVLPRSHRREFRAESSRRRARSASCTRSRRCAGWD